VPFVCADYFAALSAPKAVKFSKAFQGQHGLQSHASKSTLADYFKQTGFVNNSAPIKLH